MYQKDSLSYDYDDIDGSYGFVYDTAMGQCNLRRIGEDVSWNFQIC